MSTDRVVEFKPGNAPTVEEITQTLEDYLGAAGTVTVHDPHFVSCVLLGVPQFPFQRTTRMDKEFIDMQVRGVQTKSNERYFEVDVQTDNADRLYIDVMTKGGDEYTSVVASGFADLCARFWEGKLQK